MDAQPCLPQDIIEVNRNKEYTLISTTLLESVLTDTRLNAQTTKLWQILFNYVRFNPNFEAKISYSFLAKKLGKSERTISRYVDLLRDTGYLIIKHNFDKNGGQRPSTLSVRVPEKTIEHTKNKKDRHNKNHFNNNVTSINEMDSYFNPNKETTVGIAEPLPSSVESDVLCGTGQNNSSLHSADQSFIKLAVDSQIDSGKKDEGLIASILPAKNDRGGDDTIVLHKDNNKKDINNNNNVVVSFSQEQEITKLQNEIASLEQQLSENDKQILHIQDHSLRYDQMRKNSQIQATIHLTQIKLERTKNENNEKSKQANINRNLNDNPRFMMDKPGERVLPSFTFKRLVKILKANGYHNNELNNLVNEIVFEARFGSLINCNKTKTPLSLDNAINIALKLVRENRWSTPALLKDFKESK